MTAILERPKKIILQKKHSREQMNIVVIGHVDHGKSTVIGRLLADTNSLPQGKLEMVKRQCVLNSKPFEYAFLLDALKDEQAQGITIDSARCFFKSPLREYIIIDAPGHIEFLKNMISGAARAEAGLLVIDAKEGIQENSKRHGYLASMLGIRQLAVCVNKMDLVDYRQDVFESIREEYTAFLENVGITPAAFIPISAREGDNIVSTSENLAWFDGLSVLEMLDSFEKRRLPMDQPLRMPVQDIYKFTQESDDRRIVAGRIETGRVAVGDEVVFLPSGKKSQIATIEEFNKPVSTTAQAGQSIGLTLTTQIYIRPGELLCKVNNKPARTTTQLRANIFWLGHNPMIKGKRYKLKLAGARTGVWLTNINTILDASDLDTSFNKQQIDRHDVADCTLETLRPIACDNVAEIPQTGRFVIIDNHEIVGGGVILDTDETTCSLVEKHVHQRQQAWDRSSLTAAVRSGRHNQRSALVLICGPANQGKRELAKILEEYLFNAGREVYYLGVSNSLLGIDSDMKYAAERDEYIRRLGEISHLFTDAGMILITTISDLDDYELGVIETLNKPGELVVINVGENRFSSRVPDLLLKKIDFAALRQVRDLLTSKKYLPEYCI